jgi:hypothetical protein
VTSKAIWISNPRKIFEEIKRMGKKGRYSCSEISNKRIWVYSQTVSVLKPTEERLIFNMITAG